MESRKRANSESDNQSKNDNLPHRSEIEKGQDTTSSSEPSTRKEDDSFPAVTFDWKRTDIEKLGIKLSYRAYAMDVVYEWDLYKLFRRDALMSSELDTVEEILILCDSIPADFTSFEELLSRFGTNRETCKEFLPTEKMTHGTNGMGFCVCRFDEFQQKLELFLRDIEVNGAASVSESNFQTLFENFLSICGLITRHQPDIAVKKMKVKGEYVSSAPDILCYGLDGKVLCVVEKQQKCSCDLHLEESTLRYVHDTSSCYKVVNKWYHITDYRENQSAVVMRYRAHRKNNKNGPVTLTLKVEKKIKIEDIYDIPGMKKRRVSDRYLLDSILAKHIGDLLVYVDSSVTHMDLCGSVGRDILGFTVEKTQVTVTHLHLTEVSWEKIQTKKGSIKHVDKPVLHYSRQYDFLKKSDRQELFKVILHMKLMLSVYEKLLLQRKNQRDHEH